MKKNNRKNHSLKFKKKHQSKLFIYYFILVGFFFWVVQKSNAQEFTSPNYYIQFGNFNMTSGKKNSPSYTLTDTVGQNAPGRFANNGYVVKAGFQYIYDTFEKFSFSINNIDLVFGSISPNIGSTQSNIITITSPSGKGYEILAIASHPLLNTNYTIPDTSCNSNNCTKSSSAPWTLSTAYGFGFNALGINASGAVTNIGTSNYFTNGNYFRPFPNQTNNDSPQVFMSENNRVKNRQAKITYKVNISPNQASGNYSNLINLIAIPKY